MVKMAAMMDSSPRMGMSIWRAFDPSGSAPTYMTSANRENPSRQRVRYGYTAAANSLDTPNSTPDRNSTSTATATM